MGRAAGRKILCASNSLGVAFGFVFSPWRIISLARIEKEQKKRKRSSSTGTAHLMMSWNSGTSTSRLSRMMRSRCEFTRLPSIQMSGTS